MKNKIIIIGAGVSGLSAGIYAQKSGFDTVILEKNHFAGGNLTGWTRKDCYIDNCIHWLNGSKENNLFKIWQELGAFEDVRFHQSEDFIVSEFNNQTISLNKSLKKTYENMLKLSPDDKVAIDNFICACNFVTNIKDENVKIHKKFINALKLLRLYKRKTIDEVAQGFKHPLLKKLLSDYIIGEYSIYSLLFAYSSFYTGDGKVLKNGSKFMAENIAKKYKDLGGEIFYNTKVENIIIRNGVAKGVKLQNGEIINCDIVICCTDPKIAFNKLIDNSYTPTSLLKTYKQRKAYPIVSSFHIAYKVNTIFEIPDTFVFELNRPVLIGSTKYSRIMLRSYAYGDFTKDKKSFVLQVFLLQREKDFDKWSLLSQDDYSKEKARIVKEITDEILVKFPGLQENLEFLDCWTPLTYTKYFGAYKGSYMSFGTTKKYKLLTYPYKIKDVDNLYFASQWQKLFGGLPNAVTSGKNCIEKICKDFK